jgi:hypothetical protein
LQGEKVLFDNRLPAERLHIQGEYQGVDFRTTNKTITYGGYNICILKKTVPKDRHVSTHSQ